MAYDRSTELIRQHEAEQLPPPPEYARLASVQSILRLWLPIALGILVVLVVGVKYLGFEWWYAPLLLIFAYFFYRQYYRWRHNRRTCSPEDGVLHVEDRSHPLFFFFINGSSDDQIPLDDIQLETPTKSFLDRWVFHCDTLIAGDKKIRDVKDVKALQDIQKYRESLKKRQVVLDQQQIDVQMATLETLEAIGREIREMMEFLRSHLRPTATPVDWTQPIPRMTRHIPPDEPLDTDREEEG